MADKGPGSTGRTSGKKRLARAKIKPTEHGIKSSKGRPQAAEEEKLSLAKQKEERKKKITAVAIGIFAVIMALSMMLPSLSYIFGNSDEQQAAAEAEAAAKAEAEAAAKEAEADEDEAESEQSGIETVDASYKAVVDPLEAKLKENDKDLATLLNLGNNYMAWAQSASSYATGDDDYKHIDELFDKATDYFDKYLALNDSPAVKVNKGLCLLYRGDLDGALAAFEALTKEVPDYGPAWSNLGMIYEYKNDQDAAKKAYQKAIEADPDDEYGAKSFANRRIAAMAAQENEDLNEETGGEPTGADANATETGAAALEDALNAGSGSN